MAPKGVQSSGFSQEQRLWVILALLCIAVVSFAAGILVNKIQSKPESMASVEKGQVEPLPTGKESSNTKTVAAPPKRNEAKTAEGEQVSPAPVKLPDSKGDTVTTTRQVTARDVTSQSVPAPPPIKENQATAKESETTKAMVEPAVTSPAPAEQKPAQTAMQTTTAPVTTAPKVADSPLEDINAPAAPEPAAPAAPASAPPDTAAPAGAFTIQVGSFDTMANAEKFKSNVERKSDYEVVLHPAKDGKVVKACVGKYDTKEAAAKERVELDRVKDFKGCFVKALSEL
ncbi:MAG: SPOR domain-containing protein [Candidatus Hydrogenedentes bacterium]|nr:SPOR domain-containing protein [Candidatus Hydrogenedentota bacterium]